MNAVMHPLAEISQRARQLLVQELGVTETIRFFSQFQAGSGDYTREREMLHQGETVASVAAAIRAHRAQ